MARRCVVEGVHHFLAGVFIIFMSLVWWFARDLPSALPWLFSQTIVNSLDGEWRIYIHSLIIASQTVLISFKCMTWRERASYIGAGQVTPGRIYHQISYTSRIKSQNLNVSRLVLQLSFPNPLKPGVKSRMRLSLEQRRQAMLQLHRSDQQLYCLLRCVLY